MTTTASSPEKPIKVQKPQRQMVKIVLNDSPEIPSVGQFFSHNGRAYMLKPGVEAEVPVELLGILDDAQVSVPIMDPVSGQVEGWRPQARFPYRVVS